MRNKLITQIKTTYETSVDIIKMPIEHQSLHLLPGQGQGTCEGSDDLVTPDWTTVITTRRCQLTLNDL